MNSKVDMSNCSDRELIGFALVAIGYDKLYNWQEQYKSFNDSYGRSFNPLANTEDAVMLQCKLGLTCSAGSPYPDNSCIAWAETTGADKISASVAYAATSFSAGAAALMRAITTVAAEIGKGMIE